MKKALTIILTIASVLSFFGLMVVCEEHQFIFTLADAAVFFLAYKGLDKLGVFNS